MYVKCPHRILLSVRVLCTYIVVWSSMCYYNDEDYHVYCYHEHYTHDSQHNMCTVLCTAWCTCKDGTWLRLPSVLQGKGDAVSGPIRLIRPDTGDIRTENEVLSGVPSASTTDMPSDEEVLDSLVSNNGYPARVAVALNVSEDHVFHVMAHNARKLSTKLRTRLMVSAFTTMLKVDATLQAVLHEMPPDAVGRTYAATLGAFTQLAGQFEEQEETNESDDASSAKLAMLDRLEHMEKSQQLAQEGMQESEDAG